MMPTDFSSNDSDSLISKLSRDRNELLELIMVSVFLSFGLGLISTAWELDSRILSLGVGIAILLAVITWFVFSRHRAGHREVQIDAFLIYDPVWRELVEIPRYHFAEKLTEYARATFGERSDMYSLWLNHPIDKLYEFDHDRKTLSFNHNEGSRLLHEVVEYFILSELSLHLSGHFTARGIEKHKLTHLNGTHLPKPLQENRFLATLSTPPHLRSWRRKPIEPLDDNVVFAVGPDYQFDRFELTLPRGSRIRRSKNGTLAIENRDIKLEIRARFSGTGTVLPRRFVTNYLGLNRLESRRLKEYEVKIFASARLKWRSALAFSGWGYQGWAEAFLDQLEQRSSEKCFFQAIGWNIAETLLQIEDKEPRTHIEPRWVGRSYAYLATQDEPSEVDRLRRALEYTVVHSDGYLDQAARERIDENLRRLQELEPDRAAPKLIARLIQDGFEANSLESTATDSDEWEIEFIDQLQNYRKAKRFALIVTAVAAASGNNRAHLDLERLVERCPDRFVEAIREIVSGDQIKWQDVVATAEETEILNSIVKRLEPSNGGGHS